MEGTLETRGMKNRDIKEVNFVTIPHEYTRSSGIVIPDTLLYIVKFNDGMDYAILSADSRVSSVIGITGIDSYDVVSGSLAYTYRPTPPDLNVSDDYWQTIDDNGASNYKRKIKILRYDLP